MTNNKSNTFSKYNMDNFELTPKQLLENKRADVRKKIADKTREIMRTEEVIVKSLNQTAHRIKN